MSQVVRLEVFSEGDARCLMKALEPYEATRDEVDDHWDIRVTDGPEADNFLSDVIQAVLGCFADGRVRGFVLDTGDYRLPVGDVPAGRSGY